MADGCPFLAAVSICPPAGPGQGGDHHQRAGGDGGAHQVGGEEESWSSPQVSLRSPYCLSKYALEGFHDVLRYEMKAFGVEVTLMSNPLQKSL